MVVLQYSLCMKHEHHILTVQYILHQSDIHKWVQSNNNYMEPRSLIQSRSRLHSLRSSLVGSCCSLLPMVMKALTNSSWDRSLGAPQWHSVMRPTRSLRTPSELSWHTQPLSKAWPEARSPLVLSSCLAVAALMQRFRGTGLYRPAAGWGVQVKALVAYYLGDALKMYCLPQLSYHQSKLCINMSGLKSPNKGHINWTHLQKSLRGFSPVASDCERLWRLGGPVGLTRPGSWDGEEWSGEMGGWCSLSGLCRPGWWWPCFMAGLQHKHRLWQVSRRVCGHHCQP